MNSKRTIASIIRYSRIQQCILILLLSIGTGLVSLTVFGATLPALILSLSAIVIFSIWFNPLSVSTGKLIQVLDEKCPELEYSTELLDRKPDQLTALEYLQRERIISRFQHIALPRVVNIWPAAGVFFVSLLLFLATGLPESGNEKAADIASPEIELRASASGDTKIDIAQNQFLIDPPGYTGLASFRSAGPEIDVPEGSRVTWLLESGDELDSVYFIFSGDTIRWNTPLASLSRNIRINQDGFIRISLFSNGEEFSSPLISVRYIEDTPPEVRADRQEEFTSFEWNDVKELSVEAQAMDDYGISEGHIVATVSRGSGESVKFREERMRMSIQKQNGGGALLFKKISLDSLQMLPGDELYYYIEVRDNHQPVPLAGRSPTFFVQIRDTVSYEFAIAGDLGAEVLPEYFRSQRQIIIDTEKLIKDSNSLDEKTFKSRSNELGFDQKALRLRYSQFLGDEDEMPLDTEQEEPGNADHGHEHDHEHEDEEGAAVSAQPENPLEAYMHDHGDPEAATFFRESLRAKLKRAMAEMWDAELHLRLYEPDQSLPYQYRALELIREIKNDSRIYVHRIGFEPPPIRAEKRLTGELDEINPASRDQTKVNAADRWRGLKNLLTSWDHMKNGDDLSVIRAIQAELIKLSESNTGLFIEAVKLSDEIISGNNAEPGLITRFHQEVMSLIPEDQTPVSVPGHGPSSLRERLIQAK